MIVKRAFSDGLNVSDRECAFLYAIVVKEKNSHRVKNHSGLVEKQLLLC